MKLQNLLGNDKLKTAFSMFNRTNLPHAILIEGNLGSGKKTLAKSIAAAMVCENQNIQPCLTCSQCKKVQNNIHPDVHLTDASDGKCSVDTIRQIKSDAFVIAGEADNKIYIIDGADKLSSACQNALLKLLEEPPENVVFILLCENASMLLQTIRSRTTKFVVLPISNSDVLHLLEKNHPEVSHDKLAECSELSGGIYGVAEGILSGEQNNNEVLSDFCKTICEDSELALFEGLKIFDELSGEDIACLLRDIRITIRNAMFKLSGIDDFLPPFKSNEISLLSEKKSLEQLNALSNLFAEIQQRCAFHVSSTAMIGTLAAKIAAINTDYQ